MSRCWTCRRRRLKCDGGVPACQKCWSHGVECLGYKKPLTWVEGVARRGPMKNRTFGDSQQQRSPTPETASIVRRGQIQSPPISLTEPLFQDFDNSSRFFINYFSTRVCSALILQDHQDNHYRSIVPYVSSPVVASAIVTVAACHYIQSFTGCPMAGLLPTATKQGLSPPASSHDITNLDISRGSLLNYYLHAKDHCLRLISAELSADRASERDKVILVAVVLLAILDMFESGSGAWAFHVEGAKKLLSADSSDWDSSPKDLLQDVAIFQTFGSSLAKPGALTSTSTLPSTWTTGSSAQSAVTPIGCPVDILSAVEVFASQRRFDSMFAIEATDTESLESELNRIRDYDIQGWAAACIEAGHSVVLYDDLVHLGTIWKLAAEIYACCIFDSLREDVTISVQPPPLSNLRAEYRFLEREDDELIKCLIWPTFIAGAVSTDPESRVWALTTLDRIWHIGHCANTKGAAQVLQSLWEKHDQARSGSGQTDGLLGETEVSPKSLSGWDWVSELSQLRGSWLFV